MTRLSKEGGFVDRIKRLLELLVKHGEKALLEELREVVPKPHPAETVPTGNYLEEAKSGDLILWSGSSTISLVIRFVTQSPFSHASLVLRAPLDEKERGLPVASKPRLFQSTWSTFPEDVDGEHAEVGEEVMLNDLDLVIDRNLEDDEPGFVRTLAHPSDAMPELEEKLIRFVQQTRGDPYPGKKRGTPNPIDFLRGLLHLKKKLPNAYFCSELVAGAYQAMDVLDKSWGDSAYTPSDFSQAKDDELAKYLLPGFSFGPETQLEGEV